MNYLKFLLVVTHDICYGLDDFACFIEEARLTTLLISEKYGILHKSIHCIKSMESWAAVTSQIPAHLPISEEGLRS